MAIKQIIFVRHGESRHHVEGMTGGWTDTSLTKRGVEQVRVTGGYLSTRYLDDFGFFSSDLKRAAESASVIAECIGREPEHLEALRELNNGAATGLSNAEAQAIAHPRPAGWDPAFRAYDNAESASELAARMASALDQVASAGAERALIVGHGFAGQLLLQGWLGMPLVPRVSFDLAPASLSEIRISQFGERQLVRLNHTFQSPRN